MSCPKAGERFLKVAQTLLQRYATYLIKEREFFFLFPFGQHCRGLTVANSLLSLIPSLGPSCQGTVVDQSNTTECSSQQGFLLWSWIKTVLKGSFHASHFIISTVRCIDGLVIKGVRCPLHYPPIPPRPRKAGFLGGFR